MTEKKRILQPVNLIVFLIFAFAAEAVACLPLFEGANVFLQVGWTCYLLLGMAFLFFVGGKIERVKIVEKYLIGSKTGRFFTSCFLFIVCIGAGAAFRIGQIAGGSGVINKNTMYHLVYYLAVGLLVYFTTRLISGFRGSAAAVILMALCPLFDFSTKLPVRECVYTLLVLAAIFSISLAHYFVEKKSVSVQDTLLTILGAISLAGATFLHVSAIILVFPCIFLLIRKSGAEIRGRREQRGLRSLLFEVFYICSLVVIFLVHSVGQHTKTIDIPIDTSFFSVIGNIGKEPVHVLTAFLDKFSGLFAISDSGEYYNGLLMGMLILGIIGVILLFRKKAERRYFPVYLFNWYFFFGILLKESAYSGLILFALLAYMTAGTMEDLSELIFARKQERQGEPAVAGEEADTEEEAAVEPIIEEQTETQMEPVAAEEKEEEQTEPVIAEEREEEQTEPIVESIEEPKSEAEKEEKSQEMEAVLKEAEKKLPQPEKPIQTEEKTAPEPLFKPEIVAEEIGPETKAKDTFVPLENPLEKQIEELIKREGRIMEIVEKQNTRIAKLEEELREQRIRIKQMERHYRKELAITRNKKR